MRRVVAAKTPKRPSVLTSPAIKLRSLDVIEFFVDDAAVRNLEMEGDAALAFWTIPQGKISTLYVQGRKSGHSSLRVTTASGTRLVPIDVP